MTVNSAALAASQSMQMVQWKATQSSFALEALGVPTSASPRFESLFRGRQNRGQALRKGWLWGGGSALSLTHLLDYLLLRAYVKHLFCLWEN